MKFTFGTIVRSFSVVRVKKCILRFVSLSINKVFIIFFFKPRLAFWPFYTIKHLYVPVPFGVDPGHLVSELEALPLSHHGPLVNFVV